ncbi:MAG: NAD-dependent epimerase/dehydratase family protein [Bacteroidales bacterium]
MKTLVTGANGLLGANVVRELLNRNHQVRVLVRKGSNLSNLNKRRVEYFYGDLADEHRLAEACQGCDYVIHAAGLTPGRQITFSDFARANIAGTQNMVRAAEKAGITRMVHVSSCCVFGGGSMQHPGNELSEFTGFKFNSGYINSKYLAQQWVLSHVEKTGFPVVIVNPTIMIGPYDARPSSGEIILRILKQNLQLCPSGGKNFIDVRDAAAAACNALTMGVPGECYLLAGENITFENFYEKVNRIYGRPGIIMKIPGIFLYSAGLAGNAIQALTSRSVPLNFSNSRQLTNESYFSASKAIRFLDLRQRPVDEAIRDAITWFAANGYILPVIRQLAKAPVPDAA